jgi:hypothetical protein
MLLLLALTGSLAIAQTNPSTTSTATIAGRVVTADGGSPVRKAHVSLNHISSHPRRNSSQQRTTMAAFVLPKLSQGHTDCSPRSPDTSLGPMVNRITRTRSRLLRSMLDRKYQTSACVCSRLVRSRARVQMVTAIQFQAGMCCCGPYSCATMMCAFTSVWSRDIVGIRSGKLS